MAQSMAAYATLTKVLNPKGAPKATDYLPKMRELNALESAEDILQLTGAFWLDNSRLPALNQHKPHPHKTEKDANQASLLVRNSGSTFCLMPL